MDSRSSLEPAGLLLISAVLVFGLVPALGNLTTQQTHVFHLAAALLLGGFIGLKIKPLTGSGPVSVLTRVILSFFPFSYVVFLLPSA